MTYKYFLTVCDHLSNGVFALVGSQSYVSREVIDSYTRVFHMPYLSPSTDYHPKDHKPFSIFMKPDNTRAIASVINYLDWKEFHYVYDTDYGKFFLSSGQ